MKNLLTCRTTAMFAMMAILCAMTPLAAAERIAMPQGALLCKTIEPAIAHAKVVRQPTTEGLRAFVEDVVKREECRVVKNETTLVEVVDVDKRSFALIQDGNSQWWTDAENLWGYFDTPAKVKAWAKP